MHEKPQFQEESFIRGRVRIDPVKQIAVVDEKTIYLTPREVNVLRFLSGTFTTCEQLCERFFDQEGEIVTYATAYVHINRLKRKLPEGTLDTHRRRGYRINSQR